MIELRSRVNYRDLSPQELVRACSCGAGDAEAWGEFARRFHPLIAGIALRTARRYGEPPTALVEDLVQDAYLKLCADRCRLLRTFQPEHPDALFGFLKVVTANVVHDYFKTAHAVKRGAGQEAAAVEEGHLANSPDPARGMGQVERGILLGQIDNMLRAKVAGESSQRDRSIFWLYYRQGLTARAISLIPAVGLSAKGVESTILRLTRLVRDGLTRRDPTFGSGEKGVSAEESFS